jgi:hypothetical protein
MQSITTYGGGAGIQTTTISPTYNGGYNYTTFGGQNSGSWGGVSASPGTQMSAAVTSRGEVIPIVKPAPPHDLLDQVAEQNAAINSQIAAQNAAILSQPLPEILPGQPIPRRARGVPPAKRYPTPQPPPPNSSAYYQYAFLHNQLTSQGMRMLAKDWITDSQLQHKDPVDPHALLAYVTVWVRFHPDLIQPPAAK